MSLYRIFIVILLIELTILSGLADAQGFIHASSVWQQGKIVWSEVVKSALGFGLGIVVYWVCIRLLQEVSIISPVIQTIVWFTVTIIGVAIFSSKFWQWQTFDKIVGILVILGIIWLLARPTE